MTDYSRLLWVFVASTANPDQQAVQEIFEAACEKYPPEAIETADVEIHPVYVKTEGHDNAVEVAGLTPTGFTLYKAHLAGFKEKSLAGMMFAQTVREELEGLTFSSQTKCNFLMPGSVKKKDQRAPHAA